MTEIPPPRVFISYSWDSEPHKQRVFELAEQLRDEGIDCEFVFDKFYQDASSRLRKLWHTLTEKEQQALIDNLSGKPVQRHSLRLRGLVTADGQLFGQILAEWLREEL